MVVFPIKTMLMQDRGLPLCGWHTIPHNWRTGGPRVNWRALINCLALSAHCLSSIEPPSCKEDENHQTKTTCNASNCYTNGLWIRALHFMEVRIGRLFWFSEHSIDFAAVWRLAQSCARHVRYQNATGGDGYWAFPVLHLTTVRPETGATVYTLQVII